MAEASDKRSQYAQAVNALVRQIPIGRVMTYGLIAEILQEELGIGGPRVVGNVLAGAGDRFPHLVNPAVELVETKEQPLYRPAVIGPAQDNFNLPWWRVVNAAGSPPPHYLTAALAALEREKTPMKPNKTQVNLKKAIWFPGIDEQ